MLTELAMSYYRSGCGCAKCILCAAADYYKLDLTSDAMRMSDGLGNGFGTGSICGAAVAGVMVLSLIAENENELLSNRMKFLNAFYAELGAMNCPKLRKEDCSCVIEVVCRNLLAIAP